MRLSFRAVWQQTDQFWITFYRYSFCLKLSDHWMTDKLRAQAARFVQRFFERKDAHHEIEISGHSHNPSSIPRPDLWTDVIDLFARIAFAVQVICQPKIESGIIDKNHCIGKQPADLAVHPMKLGPKVRVLHYYIPETDDRFLGPFENLRATYFAHAWTTGAIKLDICPQRVQLVHQHRGMRVSARF